ncbi:MAG: sel1 repeat family protein, partial [Rudaea sp.]
MRNSTNSLVAATVAVALVMVGALHASERDDPAVQKTLRAMANADTDWHPDLAGEFNGLRAYAHGQYQDAMKRFLSGAYYADKLSQLCIGLMYLNGEGVAKDPVTAYAWLDLAAERGYTGFAATRDRAKAQLTTEQLEQAETKRADLARTYADTVAKHRLATQLALGRMRLTGSR